MSLPLCRGGVMRQDMIGRAKPRLASEAGSGPHCRMKSVSLNLDQELASLDQTAALQFKQAVMAMLRLVKDRQAMRSEAPFFDRIARHEAIGTWPANVDVDQHIASLRDEWDS
jgi:hypothetical protein